MDALRFLMIGWFLAGAALPARGAEAEAVPFDRVWAAARESAPALKAAAAESEAAGVGARRAGGHWWPRVYAAGRVMSTDDPAASFMYVLGQRRIAAADFSPDRLNDPERAFYGQGTMGVDLPLFEGGARVSQARAARQGAEAAVWRAKAQSAAEYARLARAYAGLLALAEERRQLQAVGDGVEAVLKTYTIGSKSNPVGYSGLLGLQNLKNRIQGLMVQNQARGRAHQEAVNAAAAGLPEGWRPVPERAAAFLEKAFPGVGEGEAASLRAARLGAQSAATAGEGERARFLPRVGLFAQGDLYHGARGEATSRTTGAYVQWDLFSPGNAGAVSQARLEARAASARAEGLERELRSGWAAAGAGAEAAQASLVLLDESAALLDEQTSVARRLFRDGSISALQLAEVLNRRVDLVVNRREAEMSLAEARSVVFLTGGDQEAPR